MPVDSKFKMYSLFSPPCLSSDSCNSATFSAAELSVACCDREFGDFGAFVTIQVLGSLQSSKSAQNLCCVTLVHNAILQLREYRATNLFAEKLRRNHFGNDSVWGIPGWFANSREEDFECNRLLANTKLAKTGALRLRWKHQPLSGTSNDRKSRRGEADQRFDDGHVYSSFRFVRQCQKAVQ